MYGFRALRASASPHLPTLIGASAVLLWSPVLGMLRTITEIFGAVGGAALIFTAAAVFSALILGVPRPSQLPRRYLLVGGALFIGTEISLSLSIGLAHHRGQALELVMINYLWPCLTVLLTVLTRMQRGSWLLLPATVLCLLGVVLVITGEGAWSPAMLLANLRSNPLAYALALAASCMWATYSLVTKRIGGSRNAVPLFMIATAAVLWLKYALGDAPRCTCTGAAWPRWPCSACSPPPPIRAGTMACSTATSPRWRSSPTSPRCCRCCGAACGCRCTRAWASCRAWPA